MARELSDDEFDDEIYDDDDDDDDDVPWWLFGALGIGVAIAPVLAPSVTYKGGDENTSGADGGKIVPLPSPPVTPHAVHLEHPMKPSRRITPHGGFGAPRYRVSLLRWTKSSATPIYPGQTPDHQHGGLDFPGDDGEKVYAVEAGTLGPADGGIYGEPGAVALIGADGRRWVYIHVRPYGDLPRQVAAGDPVATIGGNHLHLQLTVGGQLTDPAGMF